MFKNQVILMLLGLCVYWSDEKRTEIRQVGIGSSVCAGVLRSIQFVPGKG